MSNSMNKVERWYQGEYRWVPRSLSNFRVTVLYTGYSSEFDESLRGCAGECLGDKRRFENGSGSGPEGRDMEWSDMTQEEAEVLVKVFREYHPIEDQKDMGVSNFRCNLSIIPEYAN